MLGDPTTILTIYDISANIDEPSASQKAAQTASSTRSCPALFTLIKGMGEPLRSQPMLHVKRNNPHAMVTIRVVSVFMKLTISLNLPRRFFVRRNNIREWGR